MTTSKNASRPRLDREAHLANRATVLTLASVCAILLALVVMPITFQRTDAPAARLVAGTPLAVGVGVGVAARAAHGRLRAHRDEAAASQEELPGSGRGGPV